MELFSGCNSKQSEDKKHIYQYANSDVIEYLNDENRNTVMKAFDFVIPENENAIYVRSLARTTLPFLRDHTQVMYTIEIGGVNDYQNFYNINKHRVEKYGIGALSHNEFMDDGSDYYLTYVYIFYICDDNEFDSDNDNPLFLQLEDIFLSLQVL